MIELTIKVEHINYEDLTDLLLPMLREQVPQEGLARYLLRSPDKTEALVKELLSRMPQSQRDELLVKYMNRNSGKAMDKLEDMAAKNGVSIKLRDISAKTL